MQAVFERGGMTGTKIAFRLSTPNKEITLKKGVDFYLEEPPQSRTRKWVGYLTTQDRFVLWDIELTVLARDFATEIPGY